MTSLVYQPKLLLALCLNVSFQRNRIVKVTPAHLLASVCFCIEPVASIDLQFDVCWRDTSKGRNVALGDDPKQAASETQQQQADVYTLTDTHAPLDVDKMRGHAYARTCGCRKTSRETDLNLSLNSVF